MFLCCMCVHVCVHVCVCMCALVGLHQDTYRSSVDEYGYSNANEHKNSSNNDWPFELFPHNKAKCLQWR